VSYWKRRMRGLDVMKVRTSVPGAPFWPVPDGSRGLWHRRECH